jgi:hypothetical protein
VPRELDVLIARLLHIGAGVIWAGTAISFARFVEPTVTEIGASGQAFMQSLERRGFTRFVASVAVVGILAGFYLYWRVSGGLQQEWLKSGFGIVITAGSISALIAFALGPIFYIPAGNRIREISKAAGPSGPTPGQRAELEALGRRLAAIGRWSALLLVFTVLCMAGARYVGAVTP